MKKITVSIALAAMSLLVHAQDTESPPKSDPIATSAVARFVAHPYNCKQMLGGGDDGDLLPTSYSVALDASLNEIKAPDAQALTRIEADCVQRMRALRPEGMSDPNSRSSR